MDKMDIDEPKNHAVEATTKEEVKKKKGKNARRKEHIRVKAIREKFGARVEHLSNEEILSIITAKVAKDSDVDDIAEGFKGFGMGGDVNTMEDHFAQMKV